MVSWSGVLIRQSRGLRTNISVRSSGAKIHKIDEGSFKMKKHPKYIVQSYDRK